MNGSTLPVNPSFSQNALSSRMNSAPRYAMTSQPSGPGQQQADLEPATRVQPGRRSGGRGVGGPGGDSERRVGHGLRRGEGLPGGTGEPSLS